MNRKKNYLKNTDRRINIGPEGRSLFVSRDKQLQDRSVRRIRLWTRVVLALLVLAAVVCLGMFLFVYLIPYFHSEFSIEGSASSQPESSLSSGETASLPVYDEMGLPVYDDNICLFTVGVHSPAGADFAPDTQDTCGVTVRTEVAGALRLMVAAAKEDGLALTFSKGFVSYKEQETLYEAQVSRLQNEKGYSRVMARTEAKQYVPMPGECDDQSGMCVTLTGDAGTFADSQTYQWLKANMGKYGFVFRYPEYKEDSTGHVADPTVIRYVGSAHAQAMQQRSMCLEEYISYLDSQ